MAYSLEKSSGDLIVNGFEQGIAPSPHKGIANIQGANISTEIGEVMCSFNRIAQLNSTTATGILTPLSNSTVSFSITVLPGTWITITSDSGTGLSGSYYYLGSNQISQTYQGPPVTNIIVNTNTMVVYLSSGTSWTVPADWNSMINTVECIGAGGDTPAISTGVGHASTGAGGGAWSKVSNITLTPSSSVTYQVGVHGSPGTDTWFNGASLGASSVGAKGGVVGGLGAVAGGTGGQASSGIGTTKHSGGNGGSNSSAAGTAAGAGGGAAGPSGNGANGANQGSDGTFSTGGTADNGMGGIGGASGANGGNGTEYDGTHGSGGGGSGATGGATPGGNGGLYGGGAGGAGYNGTNTSGASGSNGLIRITYKPTTPITTSAMFSVRSFGKPLQSATEIYYDTSGNTQARYYILDSLGDIWVHDTAINSPVWASIMSSLPANLTQLPSGLSVINGWLSFILTFTDSAFIYWVSTSLLSEASSAPGVNEVLSDTFHTTLVGHQGLMYYTDGRFIGSMQPNSSLLTGGANVQSYCSWTAPTDADNTAGLITAIIGGSIPYVVDATNNRVPVIFFTTGTLPIALTADGTYPNMSIQYWINMEGGSNRVFQVFSAQIGGSALDITTGATGSQFFNTFNPITTAGQNSLVFTPQALILPFFEQATCIAELGSNVVVGGMGNVLYLWDQISTSSLGLINLPENNTTVMITANNMLYVFAGQKGNIYITSGSAASLVLSVPDYCAGIAGTPNSYIEPYFSWGGAMFLRGKIWFSILDQTTSKAGNCGGIWSFVPTNNLYIGQDTGQALRLENFSSYGTFNGVCPVLIPSQNQLGIGAQFWSAWYSSITSPSYGIDFTDTVPNSTTSIESDLIPSGKMLDKKTFKQIEYKVSTPLVIGESVQIYYRQNATDAYVSCGNVQIESNRLSGYFSANFQNTQWLQLKIVLTPLGSNSSSFCRLSEVRIR